MMPSYGLKPAARSEVIVIGAGAIGASTAAHLARMGHQVVVVEKETKPGLHQSLRNSGVIHAGYNLKPGTLKARWCVEGSRRLRAFCEDHHIPMRQGGILVIARTQAECTTLAELWRRAKTNGVQADLIDGPGIREIEPHAEGLQALHAPEGASFDAARYVETLVSDATAQGARVLYNVRVLGIDDPSLTRATTAPIRLRTSVGEMSGEIVINCAGLHSDRLAGPLARDLRIVPFRGYYAELAPPRRALVQSHIYPAPDLNFPFLGSHLSRRTDGRVIVGPGATLSLGRDAYRLTQVNWRDVFDTLCWPGLYRLLRRPGFPALVRTEFLKSLSLKRICEEARRLIPSLRPSDLIWSFAGNRAQLVSRRGELVDDVLLRETPRALHVLNAVSPGLTCSLPFGEEIALRAHAMLEGRSVTIS